MTQPTFLPLDETGQHALLQFFANVLATDNADTPWRSPGISVDAFLAHPEPAILARISGDQLFLLVLQSGACAVLENHRLEEWNLHETGRHLAHPDPIGAIRQATDAGRAGVGAFDAARGQHTADYRVSSLGMRQDEPFQTLLLTKGARDLPFTPAPKPCAAHAQALTAAFQDWSAGISDPFLLEREDAKGWETQEEEGLTRLVLDALLAFGVQGTVDIRAANADESLLILDSDTGELLENDIGDRTLWLAKRCLDTSRFVGHTWEYNDGASTRESGFSKDSLSICTLDLDTISQHERVAAHRRTRDRMAGITDPQDSQALSVFFDTDATFLYS